RMSSAYGKGKYCPSGPAAKAGCKNLDDLSKILRESRDHDTLLDAWKGWHSTAPALRKDFERYVELGNRGAREVGFADLGALWRAGYDMPPADFEAELARLWSEVRPFYESLHCYVRSRLQQRYGKER